MASRSIWYDPRKSWVPVAALFVAGGVLVVDDARPGGVLDGGLWIPFLYAIVPAVLGVLTYIYTRTTTERDLSPLLLVGLGVWGVIGGVTALAVVIVVGLGRSPTNPPSALFSLVTGLLTYLVPAGVFIGFYGEAGRRSRMPAVTLVIVAPVVVAVVLGVLVWLV